MAPWKAVVLCVVCLLAALPLVAAERVVTLFYANSAVPPSTWSTTLVLVNPSDGEIGIPRFWGPWPFGAGPVILAPFETFRWEEWPRDGLGVQQLSVPTEIEVYVEITNPNGHRFRAGDSGPAILPGESRQFQDLLTTGGFSSTLALAVDDRHAASIRADVYDGSDLHGSLFDFILEKGIILLGVPAGADRVVVTHGSAISPSAGSPFYALSIIQDASGAVVSAPDGSGTTAAPPAPRRRPVR